jgi:uncharacterized membrane-anchored protein
MLYSCQSGGGNSSAKLMGLLLLSCICVLSPARLLSQPAFPEVPKNAEWTAGPDVCSLGDLADVKVPEGFRFTGAAGAKALLERMKNPVPKGLKGILAPNAGGWWVILEWSPVGYVAEEGSDKLDAGELLVSLQEKIQSQNSQRAAAGMAPVENLEWTIKPAFDNASKTIEWAVKAKAGEEVVLNHTVRLLGRSGMLDAIAVRPYREGADLTAVKKFMEQVTFKQGQQYADYRPGDKLAGKSMAELIVREDEQAETAVVGGSGMKGVWISMAGVLLLVCFVAAGATVAVKRIRSRMPVSAIQAAPAVAIESAQTCKLVATHAAPRAALIKSRPKVAAFKTKSALNGHAVNGDAKQRRGFDYNRYFTDLMSHVYSGSYGVDTAPANGEEVNGNGYYAVAQANGKAVNGSEHVDSGVLSAQRSLLEEQRRLIQEQSKLIEEKSRLIEEKNKILRLQSELMDRKLA